MTNLFVIYILKSAETENKLEGVKVSVALKFIVEVKASDAERLTLLLQY